MGYQERVRRASLDLGYVRLRGYRGRVRTSCVRKRHNATFGFDSCFLSHNCCIRFPEALPTKSTTHFWTSLAESTGFAESSSESGHEKKSREELRVESAVADDDIFELAGDGKSTYVSVTGTNEQHGFVTTQKHCRNTAATYCQCHPAERKRYPVFVHARERNTRAPGLTLLSGPSSCLPTKGNMLIQRPH